MSGITDSRLSAPPYREFVRAPLLMPTVGFTLGILVDRLAQVAQHLSLGLAAVCLAVWWWKRLHSPLATVLLAACFIGLGAAHHHTSRYEFPQTDISHVLPPRGELLGAVRGVLVEEPQTRLSQRSSTADFLQRHRDRTVLELSERETAQGWIPCTGRVVLWADRASTDLPETLNGYRAGDTVQVFGRLQPPRSAANPGEEPLVEREADRGYRGSVTVSDTTTAVVRLDASSFNPHRGLHSVKQWATSQLQSYLPAKQASVARALLLGDGTAMERTTWDAYIRSGVVHVLVISGQHLAVLASFLWFVMFLLRVPRRTAVVVVGAVLLGYALMTGFRPSAVRATIMVLAYCGAQLLRRPPHLANTFCLAWFVVLVLNPTDLFDLGCRLSFLSVAMLIFGVSRWLPGRVNTPLDQLVDENRGPLERGFRQFWHLLKIAYLVNTALVLTSAPLLMAEQHVVSPVALLFGPVLIFTSSLALLIGLLFLLFGVVPGVADLLAWLLNAALQGNAALVELANQLPGGVVYVASVPGWWLAGYYSLGCVIVARGWQASRRFRQAWLAWVLLGLLWNMASQQSAEPRITFLAVGHGSCVVLEPGDGRCLLYDAGSLAGPDVVRQSIAPFLWQRGYRQVDELFISHADADHYNGVAELAGRFRLGRVSFTPSFAQKPSADVAELLELLRQHRVPLRTIAAGDRLAAADMALSVLHPPDVGPPGTENERSLVLHVEQGGWQVLLLGDLEKAGTTMLTTQAPPQVHLTQAPHHGSNTAFTPELRRWLRTQGLIVNRGDLFRNAVTEAQTGLPTWDTHTHGAITVRFTPQALILETYRSGERQVFAR